MALRPIRPEEQALIEHLLSLLEGAHRYQIPQEVDNMDDAGMGGILLSSRGAHTTDIVEADYTDSDGRDVFITLSTNQYNELYELDIWKTDFSSLQSYPEPAKVTRSM